MNHDDEDAIPPDLAGLIADLPREIEPERDLWEGVREEIEPRRVRAANDTPTRLAWWGAGLAAAAAVAMVSALVTARSLEQPPRVAATEPVEAVEQWEADVRQTTDDLMAVLDARRGSLDPEAVKIIERALAEIDSAIADVHAALARDPGNDDLEAALAGVYQRKVHLLRSAAELPMEGG